MKWRMERRIERIKEYVMREIEKRKGKLKGDQVTFEIGGEEMERFLSDPTTTDSYIGCATLSRNDQNYTYGINYTRYKVGEEEKEAHLIYCYEVSDNWI
jgi:hypothetical protein